MSKIYVPSLTTNSCVEVLDHETIRVYESTPTYNTSVNYIDYYINSSYLESAGSIVFASQSALPNCINHDNITTDFYYRNDIDKILVVFFIITIVAFYFPYRIFARAFGRWLKI